MKTRKTPYAAVLIDLFWTTIDLDFARFPKVRLERGGEVREIPSSGEVLFAELQQSGIDIKRDYFLSEYLSLVEKSMKESKAGKEEETASEDKFFAFLKTLKIAANFPPEQCRRLATRFTAVHMDCISKATVFTDDRRQVLTRLAKHLPLALVSNFDHAPAGRAILKKHQLEGFFKTIIISHDLGKRKPHATLFEKALRDLQVAPQDALMIGDSPHEDMVGAMRLAIDTAWIQRAGSTWPSELATKPTYVLSDLKDVFEIPLLSFLHL